MFKKGDTLVEVTIAIGIFSMIAVSVAAVTSSGTTESQSALETTLAREEIDAQSEALRFIHASYMTDKNTNTNPYASIWKTITGIAQSSSSDEVTKFNINTCQDLYGSSQNGRIFSKGGFILNTRKLSENPVVKASDNKSVFIPTTTYPRLLFGTDTGKLDNISASSTNLTKAEGIYVVGVKGTDTNIVAGVSNQVTYYDFYIRSCWYGTDKEKPTTISTVIRLADTPEAKTTPPTKSNQLNIYYFNSTEAVRNVYSSLPALDTVITNNTRVDPNPNGTYETILPDLSSIYRRFRGWCSSKPGGAGGNGVQSCGGTFYSKDGGLQYSNSSANGGTVSLYAVWYTGPYTVTYNAQDGQFPGGSKTKTETCPAFSADCEKNYRIPASYFSDTEGPTQSGHRLAGWSKNSSASTATYTSSNNEVGSITEDVTLYAIWTEQNEQIKIRADWTSGNDYDSFMWLSRPGGNSYVEANYATRAEQVTYNGVTYNLIEGAGDGTGNGNGKHWEEFTINTLGGKNYYYSITKYSPGWGNGVGNDITITVSGDYIGTKTFKSSSVSCSSGYWNVFAYKNGRIEEPPSNVRCTSGKYYDW